MLFNQFLHMLYVTIITSPGQAWLIKVSGAVDVMAAINTAPHNLKQTFSSTIIIMCVWKFFPPFDPFLKNICKALQVYHEMNRIFIIPSILFSF